MRIVHLLDSIASPPAPPTLGLLRGLVEADGGAEHRVVVVGPREVTASVERSGLAVSDWIAAPAGAGWRATWALARRQSALAGADAYHGWSPGGTALAARAARAGAPGDRPAVSVGFLTHAPGTSRGDRWALRRLAADGSTAVLTADRSTRDLLGAAGLPPSRLGVLHPGLASPRRTDEDRRILRFRWGAADPATRVVALVGDPPHRVDAMVGLLGAGLAAEAGRPIRMLISPRAGELHRARRLARTTGRDRLIITDAEADEPSHVLHACDMALVLTGGLGLAWSMAAGLPIIAPRTPPMAEHLADDANALLAPRLSAGELARRICRLCNDPARAARIGDAARRTAAHRFDPDRFARRLHDVYRGLLKGRAAFFEDGPEDGDSVQAPPPRPASRSKSAVPANRTAR